jgi:hypothetical protein
VTGVGVRVVRMTAGRWGYQGCEGDKWRVRASGQWGEQKPGMRVRTVGVPGGRWERQGGGGDKHYV